MASAKLSGRRSRYREVDGSILEAVMKMYSLLSVSSAGTSTC
jgi:hypothetical protein